MAEQQEILAARAVDGNGAYDVRFSIGPHRLHRSAQIATDALDMLDAARASSDRVAVAWKSRTDLVWRSAREPLARLAMQEVALAAPLPPTATAADDAAYAALIAALAPDAA